jgi:enolase-phosphatase E1
VPQRKTNPIEVVVLDIEGTTSPLDFVYGTLFPFARQHIPGFLKEHQASPEIASLLQELKRENNVDVAAGAPPMAEEKYLKTSISYLLWLMDHDRKSGPLKTLQGFVWRQGYALGELKGNVFDDVPGCLRQWCDDGLRTAIYSSGSVLAQKMLFAHTAHGDLTQFIDRYFDTRVGPKTDLRSYQAIVNELYVKPGRTLFVSDVTEELEAARSAGLTTVLSVRPGNADPRKREQYRQVQSLAEIFCCPKTALPGETPQR